MPRPLFYVVLAVIIVLWLQRVARSRASKARPAADANMPKHLVCGACGRQYDPTENGWICPQCHK